MISLIIFPLVIDPYCSKCTQMMPIWYPMWFFLDVVWTSAFIGASFLLLLFRPLLVEVIQVTCDLEAVDVVQVACDLEVIDLLQVLVLLPSPWC